MFSESVNQNSNTDYLITHVEKKHIDTIKKARDYVVNKIGIRENGLVSIEITVDEINTEKLNVVFYTKNEYVVVKAFVELVNRCCHMFQVTKGNPIEPFPTNITTVDQLKSCSQKDHYVFISWSVDLLNNFE
jgi:hypothetical protein